MTTVPIGRYQNLIDSRAIIARLEELRATEFSYLSAEEQDELDALEDVAYALGGLGDWEDGLTLIADHYFTRYARELAEDYGDLPDNPRWPLTCIDWQQAARELRHDYIDVEYRGQTFWVQA